MVSLLRKSKRRGRVIFNLASSAARKMPSQLGILRAAELARLKITLPRRFDFLSSETILQRPSNLFLYRGFKLGHVLRSIDRRRGELPVLVQRARVQRRADAVTKTLFLTNAHG